MKEIYKYLIGFIVGILLMLIPYTFKPNQLPEPITKIDTLHIKTIDTVFVPIEKIKYEDSTIIDTIYLSPLDTVLLVEQKEYKDTISTIWISGVEPKIDSIKYRIPKDTFFINKETIYNIPKRVNSGMTFNIGLGVAVGYNPITSKIEPTIGIQGTIGYGVCIGKKKRG